jgi:hypothetical protein
VGAFTSFMLALCTLKVLVKMWLLMFSIVATLTIARSHLPSFWGKEKKSCRITGFFGLFPSSSVPGSRNTMFRKLDLFPSSGEGRGRRQLLSWAP